MVCVSVFAGGFVVELPHSHKMRAVFTEYCQHSVPALYTAADAFGDISVYGSGLSPWNFS